MCPWNKIKNKKKSEIFNLFISPQLRHLGSKPGCKSRDMVTKKVISLLIFLFHEKMK